MFLFLLFLHFHSCSSFFPVPLFHLLYSLSSISFLPFSGRRHKMTLKGWRVVKPQHKKTCPVKVWLGKLTGLDITPLCWLGRKTSTQKQTSFLLYIVRPWTCMYKIMNKIYEYMKLYRSHITPLKCYLFFRLALSSKKVDLRIRTGQCRPRWLSWMRRRTGDQEVAGSTPAEVGNILSWRLIMKYFLRSFSPFRRYKKGSCQFLAKECAQYWLTA